MTRTMGKRMLAPALLVALVAVLGGALVAGSQPASAAKQKNIVQTAIAAGQFKTLVTLVKQAGLADELSGTTKLTVFAPTDKAFKAVPKATLAKLAANPALLKRVLLYHVVKGKVTAAKVVKLNSATTLAGPKLTIKVKNGKVFVSGARVVAADVMASNGVIHVIDKVLIPPA